jgi:hypothetical protein
MGFVETGFPYDIRVRHLDRGVGFVTRFSFQSPDPFHLLIHAPIVH